MEFHKQVALVKDNDNSSVKTTTTNRTTENTLSPEEQQRAQQELSQLANIIKEWKETNEQVRTLNEQVREKRKRLKVQEEMILRIMKKHNIGALDLKESGGRILYRRSSSKASLNPKTLSALLSQHLKSEQAAADAIKYITEHREAKVRESLLYEKE